MGFGSINNISIKCLYFICIFLAVSTLPFKNSATIVCVSRGSIFANTEITPFPRARRGGPVGAAGGAGAPSCAQQRAGQDQGAGQGGDDRPPPGDPARTDPGREDLRQAHDGRAEGDGRAGRRPPAQPPRPGGEPPGAEQEDQRRRRRRDGPPPVEGAHAGAARRDN